MKEYNYEIWQLKESEMEDYFSLSYDDLEWKEEEGNFGLMKEHYNKVFEGILQSGDNIEVALERLFEIFNCERPIGFQGHSMSVSDVVVINGRSFYCDIVGFHECDFENVSVQKIDSEMEAREIEETLLYEEEK